MKKEKGFTLLEILLVVAAIAILAGIVIVAINPGKQLADTRNAQRRIDINTILNAVYQYYIDHGSLPSGIDTTSKEICAGAVVTTTCSTNDLVNLGNLVADETYLVDIPSDPNGICNSNGVCYEIYKTVNNRVVVDAPDAERGEIISVKK